MARLETMKNRQLRYFCELQSKIMDVTQKMHKSLKEPGRTEEQKRYIHNHILFLDRQMADLSQKMISDFGKSLGLFSKSKGDDEWDY